MSKAKENEILQVAKQLKQAIQCQNGEIVARFFDITFLYQKKEACQELVNRNISKFLGHDLWMEAFSYLFQVPLCQSQIDAYSLYNKATAPLIRDFKTLVSNLGVPCVKSIARSLRIFATNADYASAVHQMQKLIKLALSSPSNVSGGSSLVTVINQLMAVYFQRNNVTQASKLLEYDENINPRYFSDSELCTYHFYRGRIHAINLEIEKAHDDLLEVYYKCPLESKSNRRLLLIYLIPIQFFYGKLPTTGHGLLEHYNLDFFAPFANSIALGRIRAFDRALREHQLLLIKLGIYQLMASTRKLVYYQLLKCVYEIYGSDKIPVRAFHEALLLPDDQNDDLADAPSYTIDEAESIVAGLIEMKLVKAYIHHGYHFIVFAKDPFLLCSSSK